MRNVFKDENKFRPYKILSIFTQQRTVAAVILTPDYFQLSKSAACQLILKACGGSPPLFSDYIVRLFFNVAFNDNAELFNEKSHYIINRNYRYFGVKHNRQKFVQKNFAR